METDGGTFNLTVVTTCDYRENKNDTNKYVELYLQNHILQG